MHKTHISLYGKPVMSNMEDFVSLKQLTVIRIRASCSFSLILGIPFEVGRRPLVFWVRADLCVVSLSCMD